MRHPVDDLLPASRTQAIKAMLNSRKPKREPLWDWLRWLAALLVFGDR